MNAKMIIGLLLIASFLGLGIYAFVDHQVPSVSIAVAKNSVKAVQVQGVVDFESVKYDVEKKHMSFDLLEQDENANEANANSERLTIIYPGEIPGNFNQAKSVTVIGVSGPEGFIAETMLVKCPSKYQGEDGEEKINPDSLETFEYSASS